MTATEQAVETTYSQNNADVGPVLCLCGRSPHDGPRVDEPPAGLSACETFTPTYSAPQAVHLANVTYRQWDYWTRVGLIKPAVEVHGSGNQRRWTAEELDAGRLAAALIDRGFPLRVAFRIARLLIADGEFRATVADIYELIVRVKPASFEVGNPEVPTSQEATA